MEPVTKKFKKDETSCNATSNVFESEFGYVKLEESSDMMPVVERGRGEIGTPTTFTTNMFHLRVKMPVKVYKYRIDLVSVSEQKERVLTRGPRQDLPSLDRRRVCFSVYYDFVRGKKFGDIGNKYETIYDCGNCIYSKRVIPNGDIFLSLDEISSANTKTYLGKHAAQVKATVKAVLDFDLDPSTGCEETKQFLEVLASASITREGTHLIFGNKMFNRSTDRNVEKELLNGRVLKHGAEKCVRIVGSADGQVHSVLQIDAKKSPFWAEQSVIDMLSQELDIDPRDLVHQLGNKKTLKKASDIMKDIFVETTHAATNRKFSVSGFHSKSAEDTFLERDGRQMSVKEYFLAQYNMRLKYPNMPLVVERKPQSVSYHPAECLFVPRGQRITMEKSNPMMTQAMIKKCQMPPKFMMDHVLEQKDDFVLNERNKYLQEFGLTIAENAICTTGNETLPPAIKYQSDDVQPDSRGFLQWRLNNKRFANAVSVDKWFFIVFDRCVRISDVDAFVQQMSRTGSEHGMRISTPITHDLSSEYTRDVEKLFEEAGRNGCNLIMAVTKQKLDAIHDTLKHCEALSGIVSQHVSLQTFNKVLQRNQMCTNNLLLKMNPKCGGVNHSVDISRAFSSLRLDVSADLMSKTRNRMIVGISLSHAGPQSFADRALKIEQSEPTVVGMSFSMKVMSELSSDYWFQRPRLASITDIRQHFVDALNNRKSYCGLPDEIIVFRAGSSEGEFAKVQTEMDAIAEIFSQFEGGKYSPSLTAVVVMRDSNYRLFPAKLHTNGSAKDQNVRPGSVVDCGITNPKYSEFIMVPHTALQGSCKPIRCTVVTYKKGTRGSLMKLKELEVLTNGLCYAHQASTMPTGIPAVLYAAENVAKRARNNWKYSNYSAMDTRSSYSGGGQGKWVNDGSPDFFQRMTQELKSKASGMYWA